MKNSRFIRKNRVLAVILLTTFVTACVKNTSKDDPAPQLKSANLAVEDLRFEAGEVEKTIVFSNSSDVPVLSLTKDYRFNTQTVAEFDVRRGTVNNEVCRSDKAFNYSFALVDQNGLVKAVKSRGHKSILTPGNYRLRVSAENGSLCQKINLEITLRLKPRPDLVVSKDLNLGYRCQSVEKNNRIESMTWVQVNTHPLKVEQVKKFKAQDFEYYGWLTNDKLCNLEISARENCVENLSPAPATDRPWLAKSVNCNNPKSSIAKSQAYLQFNWDKKDFTSQFSCISQHKNVSLNLGNCELTYKLGEELDVLASESQIEVYRNRVHIKLSPNVNSANLQQSLNGGFVGLVMKNKDGDYHKLTKRFYPISFNQIFDFMKIKEDGIGVKMMQANPKDLAIVITSHNHITFGEYYVPMNRLCALNETALTASIDGETVNLCE